MAILAHFDPILPYKSKGISGNFGFLTYKLTQRFRKFRAIFQSKKGGIERAYILSQFKLLSKYYKIQNYDPFTNKTMQY